MTVTRQNPTPRVYAWVPRVDGLDAGRVRHDMLDLSRDVVSLHASRSEGAAMGSASLELLPRTGAVQTTADLARVALLYQRLDLMTVVSIGIDEDGGIGLYLVRAVNKRKRHTGPMAGSGLTVQLADFGYTLGSDHVVFASLSTQTTDKFRQQISATLGAESPLNLQFPGLFGPKPNVFSPEGSAFPEDESVTTFLAASVKDAVDYILDKTPSMRVPLLSHADGTGGKPGDFIDTSSSITSWNDARVWSDNPTSFHGTVWDFLWTVLDRDFYEIRLDYRPSSTSPIPTMELIVRPKPFDEPALEFLPVNEDTGITWDALRTFIDGVEHHEIHEHEVLEENLGVSGADAFAVYMVTSANDLIGNDKAAAEGIAYPVVDTFHARKFGIQQYNARLALLASDIVKKAEETLDYDDDVLGAMGEFRNRLVNWYRLAPWFETGTITVVGRDRYRVGDPVRLPHQPAPKGDELGMRYYTTSVSWSWSYGSAYVCQLTLSRGHNATMVDALRDMIDNATASTPTDNGLVTCGEASSDVAEVDDA